MIIIFLDCSSKTEKATTLKENKFLYNSCSKNKFKFKTKESAAYCFKLKWPNCATNFVIWFLSQHHANSFFLFLFLKALHVSDLQQFDSKLSAVLKTILIYKATSSFYSQKYESISCLKRWFIFSELPSLYLYLLLKRIMEIIIVLFMLL